MNPLVSQAQKNLHDILSISLNHPADKATLVVYDEEAPLTRILVEAYRLVLPQAEFLAFQEGLASTILEKMNALQAGDLVILVQSTNFRLNEFRLRIELFKRHLKTIEHVHLGRMSEDQFERYIQTLAYDPTYYRGVGSKVKARLDQAKKVQVLSGGCVLNYEGEMEEAKLNVGDYTGMENIGGTFPIGEVFTEAKDFAQVNGEAMIYGFGGMDHKMLLFKPFKIIIEKGILTRTEGAPPEFEETLALIRQDEELLVREFGIGMNRAVGKDQLVNDVTAFERQKGLHFSLGSKHSVYNKPGLRPKHTRYHVDIFVDVDQILTDGQPLFTQGEFVV